MCAMAQNTSEHQESAELRRTPCVRTSENPPKGEVRRISIPRTRVHKGRRKYGSLTHRDFTRDVGLLAHPQQQTTPPGGWLRSRRLSARLLPAGLGSDLRCPRHTPAASSLLRCPHLVPTYPPHPLPRPSRFGCGLLGASSFCPQMNEAELSPWVSSVSEPDPTRAQGSLTSLRPKRNATNHRIPGSRLRYWLCPSLKRPSIIGAGFSASTLGCSFTFAHSSN